MELNFRNRKILSSNFPVNESGTVQFGTCTGTCTVLDFGLRNSVSCLPFFLLNFVCLGKSF
jgi:hypothetical protein